MIGRTNQYVALFDVGGVLVNTRPNPADIAQILGFDAQDHGSISLVDHAMWAHRDDYDKGCTDKEFWDRVAGDCGLGEIEEHTLQRLIDTDTERMKIASPFTVEAVRTLHESGIACGILSNAPHAIAQAIRATQWFNTYFSFAVFSAEIGVCKPHRAIYRSALEKLNIPPKNVLFIDDRQENLRGAELLGMSTLLWDGSEESREILQRYGHTATSEI
nr:HAD family phosphatase [Schaalia sp. lx-100]